MAEVSDSDINIDDDNDDGDDGYSKNNDLRSLEQFLGNSGLTFTPDDPTSISEIVNHFLGKHFLEILVEQSDLYHAQKFRQIQKLISLWHGKMLALHIGRSFLQ
jgi:hypothetical protein